MDKEDVVHIYNGILLSHKKEHIWVSSKEVDEPRAYYTEWSKSERQKHCILMYIPGSRKIVLMNIFAGQQWRCRHREQTCGHNGERRGRDK